MSEPLARAFRLYRAHGKAFLLTAAIALLPFDLVHAGLVASLLAPPRTASLERRSERMERRAAELQRQMESGKLTPEEMAREQERFALDVSQELGAGMQEVGGALGRFGIYLLSLVLLVPLTILATYLATAALVPMVADRERGGALTAGGAWAQAARRLPQLLVTSIIASVAVLAGFVLFVVPGVVLAFFFAFATPVVMLEGASGLAALRRSARLVRDNWVRVAIVLAVFAALTWLARFVGSLFVPGRLLFASNLLQDLVALVVFPFPVIGLVLLFEDVRRGAPRTILPEALPTPAPAH